MAKLELNSMFNSVKGSLNEISFRRMYGKQTIMNKPDMSHVEWSDSQKAHRQRFREASIYASAAMSNEQVRARYVKLAAEKGKRPRDLAVSDFFKGIDLLKDG
jgi:hypothetical protein